MIKRVECQKTGYVVTIKLASDGWWRPTGRPAGMPRKHYDRLVHTLNAAEPPTSYWGLIGHLNMHSFITPIGKDGII